MTARLKALKGVLETAAAKVGLPPWFLAGQADKESSLNPKAVSAPGSTGQRAYGLLQLNLSTFQSLMPKGDPLNPLHNLLAGGTYLRQLQAKFGTTDLALAAYNWGPSRVSKLTAKLGNDFERIKASLPLSVRWYVWRVGQLAAQHAPYWRA